MRLDRFLTLYFFRPLSRIRRLPNGPRVAILMYHSISEPDKIKRVHPYYETCTSPKVFAQHMKFLHDNNYEVISLDEAVNLLFSSRIASGTSENDSRSLVLSPKSSSLNTQSSVLSPQDSSEDPQSSRFSSSINSKLKTQNSKLNFAPARPNRLNRPNGPNRQNQPFDHSTVQPKTYVVLTFDDGYQNFYTGAFPILERYDFPATVFLSTAYIAGKGRRKFKGKNCLTWSEVRELHHQGIIFGSHTVTHPKLVNLERNKIEHELKKSKKEIEDHIDHPVKAFCYPFAFPEQDKRFVTILLLLIKECGYEMGVTTRVGLAYKKDNIFSLKRIPMNTFDDENFFLSKLSGAYNWLQKFQYVYKKVKELKKAGWSKRKK